jgi:hypothetical protein
MKFVQIIEYNTKDIDAVRKLDDEWMAATEGKRPAGRGLSCADRDNPGRYFAIVEFASYEDAMRNNELPETEEFSEKMMGLADGPPTFYNLDVLYEQDA